MTTTFRRIVALVRQEFRVCRILMRDDRAGKLSKVLIGLAIAYAVTPVDLIPNLIPVIGFVDDLVIVPVLVCAGYRNTPREVLAESRSKARL